MRIPCSTYRLQFNHRFTFSDAKKVIKYLYELGITEIYASPYLKASKGSLHGYDIVDYNSLNHEIGTAKDYEDFIKKLEKYKMGQIFDFVPNHMCITDSSNLLWMDVLENGQSSLYSDFFDIDWHPVKKELENKILLPILGNYYGLVLENQELKLIFYNGAFFIDYYEHRLPIRPQTYIKILNFRIEELEKSLSSDSSNLMELLSIITALNYLPTHIERDPEKIKEIHREKEVIKKRLWNLYRESQEIKNFIDENVNIFNGIKGEPRSFDLLDELLNEQVYRISYWRVACEEINYRKFFDINELAAIKMENPEVFKECHRFVFQLIKEGKITGLRIDHPDGLYNPSEYFKDLQKNCFIQTQIANFEKVQKKVSDSSEEVNDIALFKAKTEEIEKIISDEYEKTIADQPDFKPFYIVGEKILMRGEKVPDKWGIHGSTGYVFLNYLNGIFIKIDNTKPFDGIYKNFTGEKIEFNEIVYESKKMIMKLSMASEINTLGHHLNTLSEKDRRTRDFTLNSLTDAIVEVIAFFPVYRTYINNLEMDARDRKYIEIAVSRAKKKNPDIEETIEYLKNVLLLQFPDYFNEEDRMQWFNFVMKFQQITGPVMAKGMEDTAFYIYNKLISLNEVGGMPDKFGITRETFHGQNIERLRQYPYELITTSTHDTKRSEDVRARINVLSEIPDEWKKCLSKWNKINRKKKILVDGKRVPDKNEEYLLYQTLIGTWPFRFLNDEDYTSFKVRIKKYMVKALREAQSNTSWINPFTLYEDAMTIFIERILDGKDNKFLDDFIEFEKKIFHYGIYNSLSQTLLKITSPGVPDFYQGTEIWDFSLVDPDNRRDINFELRKKMLAELKNFYQQNGALKLVKELIENREDGKIKMYVIYKALNFRKRHRYLFEKGEYIPLEVFGERSNNICTFARRIGQKVVIVAIARFFTELISDKEVFPFDVEWKNSFIAVPFAEKGEKYRNIFTDEVIEANDNERTNILMLSKIFVTSPVVLLEKI